MRTVAIICEYDPFHRGHKHQIEIIREKFGSSTTVISLMSGSVVQRGRLSIYPKHLRAEAAIKCGSDLVLELPCPYSCSSAEFFSMGAVTLLNAIGSIDILAFGSESGDISTLDAASSTMISDEFIHAIKNEGKNGHIKASEEIFRSLGGEKFPDLPNDILGIEYISALKKTESSITPFTYKRQAGWSATRSRQLLCEGGSVSEMIPDEAINVFGSTPITNTDIYSSVALHTIRNSSESDLTRFFGMNGGVAGLIKGKSEDITSVEELISACTTKAYTSARIRRAILSSVLMITEENVRSAPTYTSLLGANAKGREFLNKIKKTTSLSIVTKPADALSLPPHIKEQFEISLRADRLMSLCRSESTSTIFRRSPFMDK